MMYSGSVPRRLYTWSKISTRTLPLAGSLVGDCLVAVAIVLLSFGRFGLRFSSPALAAGRPSAPAFFLRGRESLPAPGAIAPARGAGSRRTVRVPPAVRA